MWYAPVIAIDRLFLCFIYCESRDWIQSRAFDARGNLSGKVGEQVEIVVRWRHVMGSGFSAVSLEMVIDR